MKDKIFISHATPVDNEFAAWLATKLELFGYNVWVDIRTLNPSVDFWEEIETTIREETVKFVFVVTHESSSGKRDGVKKELAIADRVRKQNDKDFIVPLRIDDISFDDFPSEILRLNGIDFHNNWGKGLINLMDYLEKSNIPKKSNIDYEISNAIQRWKGAKTSIKSEPIQTKSFYYSNVFPLYLPKMLYIYPNVDLEHIFKSKFIPYVKIESVIVTLACPNCISKYFGENLDVYSYDFESMIYSDDNIIVVNQEIKKPSRLCMNLLNWNIDNMFSMKGLYRYKFTSGARTKNKYYFKSGTKSKRHPSSRPKNLSGRYRSINNWHYSLSSYYVKSPQPGILLRSHMVFTDKNKNPLDDSRQITARRNKGRLLFNKEWRDLLKSAVYFLAEGKDTISSNLCCDENQLIIHSKPYMFTSPFGYNEPSTEPEEIFSEFTNDDEY